MVTQRGICNRCKAEIKSDRDGYSVSATPGTWLTLDIVKGINPYWEEHYCGKECLMLVLNEKADALPQGGDSPGSENTGHFRKDSGSVPFSSREECYEDHVAA